MEKYSNAFIRKLEKRNCWQGTLKYKEPNPNYVQPITGKPDTRKPSEKRPEVWKQVSKCFDPETVRTKSQATKALEQWRQEMEAAAALPAPVMASVPDYVDAYLQKNPNSVEPSTLKGYKTLANIIRKGFKKLPLSELTGKRINAWVQDMKAQGYSDATQTKTYKLLKLVCSYAVKVDDLTLNPFDKADPPKSPKADPNAMTDKSIQTLKATLSGMEPTPLVVAAYMGMYMGLREAEICALQWQDVDFKRNIISVHQAIGRAEGEKATYLKGAKTDGSNRYLPIPPQMRPILLARYKRMGSELEAAGVASTADNLASLYVIGYVDGRYKNPNLLGKEWRAFAEAFDLVGTKGRLCTFHDTRHTFATKAVAARVDVKTVASYLGHTNAAMTLNIYADADETAKRIGAAAIGAALDAI